MMLYKIIVESINYHKNKKLVICYHLHFLNWIKFGDFKFNEWIWVLTSSVIKYFIKEKNKKDIFL